MANEMSSSILKVLSGGTPGSKDDPSDLMDILNAHPGPALLFTCSGTLLGANPDAASFAAPGDEPEPALVAMAMTAHAAGDTKRTTLGLIAGGSARRYDTIAMPLDLAPGKGQGILILMREITEERAIIDALAKSRQLYKDLVSCSSDFAWETDAAGCFTFLSGIDCLGYAPGELVGRAAESLLVPRDDGARAANPFVTRHALSESDAWLVAKDGSHRRLTLSAVPVHNKEDRFDGARGIGRDVTEERERKVRLERMQAEESLLMRIVIAMRDATSPRRLLNVAAAETAAALRATHATIYRIEDGHPLAAASAGDPAPANDTGQDAGKDQDADDRNAALMAALGAEDGPLHWLAGDAPGGRALVGEIRVRDALVGAVLIDRDTDVMPWRDHETRFLERLLHHLGAALEQARAREQLEYLSQTDELTGLMNRRAFDHAIRDILAAGLAPEDGATMLYVDLDHFKAVNDTYGHVAGDRVLALFGRELRSLLRTSDIAARIGGDEFVLWIGKGGLTAGRRVADALIALKPALCEVVGAPGARVSLSIGMVMADAVSADFLRLCEAADAALYEAKKRGRDQLYIEESRS